MNLSKDSDVFFVFPKRMHRSDRVPDVQGQGSVQKKKKLSTTTKYVPLNSWQCRVLLNLTISGIVNVTVDVKNTYVYMYAVRVRGCIYSVLWSWWREAMHHLYIWLQMLLAKFKESGRQTYMHFHNTPYTCTWIIFLSNPMRNFFGNSDTLI